MERLINCGKSSGRAYVNDETIKMRINVYESQTAPLIDWYKSEEKHHAIKGHGSLEEINADLCAVIDAL